MTRFAPQVRPVDMDEAVAVGIAFPLTVGNSYQNYTTAKQVHDNLKNLLLTMPGERIYYPTFGSNLYRLLFEPMNDEEMIPAATNAVETAVEEWMPFVEISQVRIISKIDEQKVKVIVNYKINGWPAPNVLNMDVKV
mgnify:FL=1